MKKLTLIFLLLILTGCDKSEDVLKVYIWPDYISHQAVSDFEEQFGKKVIFDVFDSNEAMYAKLKAGASGYDLILPSNYFLDLLESQGMLEPLDYSKIPNFVNVDLNYIEALKQASFTYSVPYMIGITGIGYRKDRLPDIENSWAIFADSRLKGRMTMLNDIREVIGAGLKYLGYSANSTSRKEIEQATKVLLDWRKNIVKYESESYKNGLASAEFLVAQAYTADIVQVILDDPQVGCLFPMPGTTMSYDSFVIPKGAKNKELAHMFINFMLEPKNAALNMDTNSHLSPVTAAYPLVNEDLRSIPAFIPTKEEMGRLELMRDIGQALEYYIEAWRILKDDYD